MFKIPTGSHLHNDAEAPKQGFGRLFVGLVLLVSGLLAVRLPLWLLPGPGRDEAAYHYWVHHPEPFYAPLLQWAVRLAEVFCGHSLWSLRAPVLILGVGILWLNDRRLAGIRTPLHLRWLAVLALAFSPWQGFAGSILHPDNFLLAALLALVLAVQHNRLWLATAAAVIAVLAKPTGVLFLPVAWWLCGTLDDLGPREKWAARAVLLATALAVAATVQPEMMRGMADFGRLDPTTAWYARILAAGGALLFLGGPVLVGLSFVGARQRWYDRHQGPDALSKHEARASLAIAAMMLAVFLAAAVLRGQFKGNWVLPALVLLWPVRMPAWTALPRVRALVVAGLVLTFAASLGQTLIMVRPGLVDRVEGQLSARGLVPAAATYSVQAGVRETSVSTSRSWSDHLRQYNDASLFAAQIKAGWCEAQGAATPVPCLVAGDYGLACQLHWYLGDPATRVAIHGDGIFHRTWTDLRHGAGENDLLFLSGPGPDDFSTAELRVQALLPAVMHPVTGRPLQPTIARWHNDLNQETPLC